MKTIFRQFLVVFLCGALAVLSLGRCAARYDLTDNRQAQQAYAAPTPLPTQANILETLKGLLK